MYKFFVCFCLFFTSLFIWDISTSVKKNNISVELLSKVDHLDSVNIVLTNKLIEQEKYYNHKIDSLSNIVKNIRYDVNKIRKYSTMIP